MLYQEITLAFAPFLPLDIVNVVHLSVLAVRSKSVNWPTRSYLEHGTLPLLLSRRAYCDAPRAELSKGICPVLTAQNGEFPAVL